MYSTNKSTNTLAFLTSLRVEQKGPPLGTIDHRQHHQIRRTLRCHTGAFKPAGSCQEHEKRHDVRAAGFSANVGVVFQINFGLSNKNYQLPTTCPYYHPTTNYHHNCTRTNYFTENYQIIIFYYGYLRIFLNYKFVMYYM